MIRALDWEYLNSDLVPRSHLVIQAVIGLPPKYFEDHLSIEFTEDFDDLDYYVGALLSLEDGTIFALKQQRENDQNTTSIYIPITMEYLMNPGAFVEEITETIGKILLELKIDKKHLMWQRKDNPEA